MKTLLAALVVLLAAPQEKGGVVAVRAEDVAWTPAPGLAPGMATALQWGSLEKGPYQLLIKFPAGALVAPHFHGSDEFATVVSGTLLFGQGETVEEAKGVEISAGGYVYVPTGTPHWVKASTDAVLVRFGAGPRDSTVIKDGVRAPGLEPVKITRAQDLKWEQTPGMAPGLMTVLQHGDPAKGPYFILLKFPAGTFNPSHWHSADEVVTVLQGSIVTGEGVRVDDARGKAVGPGGYFLIPARTPHWGKVPPQGEVILTRLGNGPRDIHYFAK